MIAIDAASGQADVGLARMRRYGVTGITGAPHVGERQGVHRLQRIGYRRARDRWWLSTRARASSPGDSGTSRVIPPRASRARRSRMAAKTWSGGAVVDGAAAAMSGIRSPTTRRPDCDLRNRRCDAGRVVGDRREFEGPSGDRLYAGCIVAVNADTGEYVWHYQTSTPFTPRTSTCW